MRAITTNNSLPRDARGPAHVSPGPHVRVVARIGNVCIPVIRKFIQHPDRVAADGIRIGSTPGVLKYNRKRQPDIASINRVNLVHDAEDLLVRDR